MSAVAPALTRSDPADGKRCHLKRLTAGAVISVDTTDFEEFCESAVGWNLDHQVLGRVKPRITMSGVITPVFQLAMVKDSGGYCSQGTNPEGAISVAVPLDQARPMIFCGRSIGAHRLAITRSGDEFELINRFGAHHLVVSFSHLRLEQYASNLWHEPPLQRHLTNQFRFQDIAHRQRFVEACNTVLTDVRKQSQLLSDARRVFLLEDRLLENLLLQGYSDPRHSSDRSRFQVARRARRHLLEASEEVPSIRNLCAMTGASYATLERGYREIYGMAPQMHIKALRLSRARKELRQANTRTTVTDIALRWGFFELGRFAVQYRQRFGETPSDTLRKARGDSPRIGEQLPKEFQEFRARCLPYGNYPNRPAREACFSR